MELSKGVKIGIGVMAVVIILMIIYFVFSGDSSTTAESADEIKKIGPVSEGRDPYFSKETYEVISQSDMGTYEEGLSQDKADRFWSGIFGVFGPDANKHKDGWANQTDTFVVSWFKGMNLFQDGNYVWLFKDDIKRYVNSKVKTTPNTIKVGQFIKQ